MRFKINTNNMENRIVAKIVSNHTLRHAKRNPNKKTQKSVAKNAIISTAIGAGFLPIVSTTRNIKTYCKAAPILRPHLPIIPSIKQIFIDSVKILDKFNINAFKLGKNKTLAITIGVPAIITGLLAAGATAISNHINKKH